MTTQVHTFDAFAARVLRAPPGVGRVRVVAVDGPAGSGKTTFSARLAAALGRLGAVVVVVAVDDVRNGWSDVAGWWAGFRREVLDPLSQGHPAAYRRYDWQAGRYAAESVPIGRPDVLVLDGVGSASVCAEALLSVTVWVAVDDPAVAFRRLLRRDGDAYRADLERWVADERAHFAADRTATRADVHVDGGSDVHVDGGSDVHVDGGSDVHVDGGSDVHVDGGSDVHVDGTAAGPHGPETAFVVVRGTGHGVDGVARLGDDPGVHPSSAQNRGS